MIREPVYVDGKLTGHKVTTDPVYITTRTTRGDCTLMLRGSETVFEPVKRQRSLIEED